MHDHTVMDIVNGFFIVLKLGFFTCVPVLLYIKVFRKMLRG